ncbi:MAG: histidine phosphatase family protein, partial [Endozoicomonas sp.]
SPLPRTLETAEILMDSLKLPAACRDVDSRVIEVDAGERDGQCYRKYNDQDFWFPDNPERFGGESREQVQARVIDLVQSLLNDQQWDLEHQFIVIVSHGVPLLLIQEYLGGGSDRLETAGWELVCL